MDCFNNIKAEPCEEEALLIVDNIDDGVITGDPMIGGEYIKIKSCEEEEEDLFIVVDDVDDSAISDNISNCYSPLSLSVLPKIGQGSVEAFVVVDDPPCNGFNEEDVIDPSVFERASPASPTPSLRGISPQVQQEPNVEEDEEEVMDAEGVEDEEEISNTDSGFAEEEPVHAHDPDYIPESRF